MTKFSETKILEEIDDYIHETYKKHYAEGKYQATDMIIDAGYGEGFCIGNIMKYAQRYGRKNWFDDRDLYKILHYAIILLGQKLKEEDEFREYQHQLQLDSD